MVKALLRTLALCLLALSLALSAWAGPTLDHITKTGVLRVGTDPTYPPLMMKTKDGKIIGFEADLARMLAQSLHAKLKLVAMPFTDLLPALQSGMVDVVISGMSITADRNRKAMFVGPYMASGQSMLTRMDSPVPTADIKEMNKPNIKVAAAKGTTGEMAVKGLLPNATYIPAADQEAALKLLLAKKVDLVVADFPFCAVAAFRYRAKGIMGGDKAFTFEPFGIAVAPGDDLFVNLIENFLIVLKGTGQLQRLQQIWFHNAAWMKQLPK